MTARPFRLKPHHKAAILTVYAAARRIAVRRFEGGEAAATALYWTAFHTTKALGYNAPLIRAAFALGLDPNELMDRINAYHAVHKRDEAACEAAYREFLALYRQMAPDDDADPS